MPARKRKIRMDDITRTRIQGTQIIKRLQAHVFGELKLSITQIRAAEILLRKVLPDLVAADIGGYIVHAFAEVPKVLTEDEWLRKRAIVSGVPSPDPNLH
jgi:hypothetical protein